MPVPTLISQLSTSIASNSPGGSESSITNDDYLRAQAAFIAQLRDGTGFTSTIAAPGSVRVSGATQGLVGTRVGGGSGATAAAAFDDIIIDSSVASGLTIISGAASLGGVAFGDSGSSSIGRVQYDHVTDTMTLMAGGVTAVSVQSFGLNVPGLLNAVGNITGSADVTTNGGKLGYSLGAGGIITQGAGSGKATTVTLNRRAGRINMNGAALSAGASVSFQFVNSLISTDSVVCMSPSFNSVSADYSISVLQSELGGSCFVTLKNLSAGSLSEAVVLRFVVLAAPEA